MVGPHFLRLGAVNQFYKGSASFLGKFGEKR